MTAAKNTQKAYVKQCLAPIGQTTQSYLSILKLSKLSCACRSSRMAIEQTQFNMMGHGKQMELSVSSMHTWCIASVMLPKQQSVLKD